MFVCFVVLRPTGIFFTHTEPSPLRLKGFNMSPKLGTQAHWALSVFRVTHLCWHGACLYNGHLGEPVTLTPVDELLAVEQSLPVFTTYGLSNALLTDCATAAVVGSAKAHLANFKEFIYRNSVIMFPIWSSGDKITSVQSLIKQTIS